MNDTPLTGKPVVTRRRSPAISSLADLSIRRPVFAWMLMAAMIIFGAIGLSRLGVSEQPDVDFPVLTINATWSGAAPEVMETEIVDKIEEQVISTQGIRNVTSQIQQGQASITLEFEIERNIDAALTEVQSKLSSVVLPLGADQPTILKSNPEDQPILLLSASSKSRDIHALTEYLELNVIDQLKILPGVGEVTLAGYEPRNLRVWVDNQQAQAAATDHPGREDRPAERTSRGSRRLPRELQQRIQRADHGRRRHARGGGQYPDQETGRRRHLQFEYPHPRRGAGGGRARRHPAHGAW